jgi:hypothetical protein
MNGPDNLLPSPIEAAAVPEVRNHTRFPSQYFQMMDANDAMFHVMVTRITYDLKALDADGYPALCTAQTELIDADLFYGEANASSVIAESDYAPFKPKCDVLLINASAWAPPGTNGERAALTRYSAGIKMQFAEGSHWQKLVTVTGPRMLTTGLLGGLELSAAQPTERVELRYELAYGGTNQWWKGWPTPAEEDQRLDIDLHDSFNPIGCGLIDTHWRKKTGLGHFPAPQIEVFDQPFTETHAARGADSGTQADAQGGTPNPIYPAVGLGPIGRWWLPRRAKAGSYDAVWKATRWPKLPKDFDFGYWNCAPEDQQIDYPLGGELVLLLNLIGPEHSSTGNLRFRLPKSDLHQRLRLHAGPRLTSKINIDTVIIDAEAMTLTLVHRAISPASAEVRVIEIGIGDGGDHSDGDGSGNGSSDSRRKTKGDSNG